MALKYRSLTKGYDPAADKLLEDINITTQFRDKQQEEYNSLLTQAKPLEGRLTEIEQELRNSARDVIREKQLLRDQLEKQKKFIIQDCRGYRRTTYW